MFFVESIFDPITRFLRATERFPKILRFWEAEKFDGEYDYSTCWTSTDTKENFEKQGNKKYNETSIEYHFNSHGFRIQHKQNQEVTSDNIIACFGCSQTLGVGLPYEETWPFLLGELLNNSFVVKNYGISGASLDTIVRKAHNYLLENKPKIICCLIPDMFRKELFETKSDFDLKNFLTEDGYESSSLIEKCKRTSMSLLDWRAYARLFGEDNSSYCYIKNIIFLELLCQKYGAKLLISTWNQHILRLLMDGILNRDSFINLKDEEYKLLLQWHKLGIARDGMHMGKQTNELYAKLFANAILSNK